MGLPIDLWIEKELRWVSCFHETTSYGTTQGVQKGLIKKMTSACEFQDEINVSRSATVISSHHFVFNIKDGDDGIFSCWKRGSYFMDTMTKKRTIRGKNALPTTFPLSEFLYPFHMYGILIGRYWHKECPYSNCPYYEVSLRKASKAVGRPKIKALKSDEDSVWTLQRR